MSLPGEDAAYEAVQALLRTSVPSCTDKEEIDGVCYTKGLSGEGYIVYSDVRESCQSNWILLQGFDLLPRGLLVVVYTLTFVWIFFGVAICSDIFVEGIESITSMTRTVIRRDPRTGVERKVKEPIWNWVVANISLMACGSSAPEILLAVVEAVIRINETAGELGPSTIVGSAAYNLFAITAVCTMSLPIGTYKKIEHWPVFATTAIWSIWAHIWMYLVYKVITPDVIDVWEAWLTLLQFPILIIHAFIMDKQPWNRNRVASLGLCEDPESPTGAGSRLSSARGSETTATQRRSILYYRNLAVRHMAGESKNADMLHMMGNGALHHSDDANGLGTFTARQEEQVAIEANIPEGAMKLGFGSLHYSVLESTGAARVTVKRYDGDMKKGCSVAYYTKDGTAVAGLDYEYTSGMMSFAPNETEHEVVIPIIDDDMSEPDVTFSLVLKDPVGEKVYIAQQTVQVTVVDDDDGGMITFELPTFEAGMKDPYVDVPVIRRNGHDGQVTVEYTTKDGTAVAGAAYTAVAGTLEFASGEVRATIRVPLLSTATTTSVFKVVLSNPLGGAVLGRRTECRVIISPGTKLKEGKGSGKIDMKGSIKAKAGLEVPSSGDEEDEDHEPYELWPTWRQQFIDALVPDIEQEGDGVWLELILHYISVTWKVIMAFCPPADWRSGFPCFFGSLAFLVGIVSILKQFAELWGCSVTLSPLMTGLSLVALGTSLPDTFASRMAAVHDDTADAAIGNITASNSVNIFLGLGIPWVIVAHYRQSQGVPYVVESGALGFSLVVFCCLCGAGLGLLTYRRFQGGELGSSTKAGRICLALTYLSGWLLFLVLSGVNDYGHISNSL